MQVKQRRWAAHHCVALTYKAKKIECACRSAEPGDAQHCITTLAHTVNSMPCGAGKADGQHTTA